MSNSFQGEGNIGQAPVLRTVNVNGETRPVVDLRVFIDRSIKQDDGSYEDEGGFWLTVSIWGYRAEMALKLLAKGMRIHVSGRLTLNSWEDENNVPQEQLCMTADRWFIDPICVESIQRKRNGQAPSEPPEVNAETAAAA